MAPKRDDVAQCFGFIGTETYGAASFRYDP
jgi:hypothetical protein